MLEIGSYIGASACCIGAAMKECGRGRLICIDTWNNDAMSEGPRDTFSEFLTNTTPYNAHILPIRGVSTEVVGRVVTATSVVDLLFIDGDHSYEGAKADWDTYCGFLRSGSIVVFHDSGWAQGVMRVIEEDVRPRISDCAKLPNMWWGEIRS